MADETTTVAMQCSDCKEIFTVTSQGQHEQQVRHDRERTVATPIFEAPEFHALVTRHRARGCPARQFREVITDGQA